MKFAVIGTNFISDLFCEAAREVEGAEVAAVLSRSRERGVAFAQRHSVKTVFTDLCELLSAEDIDAVYIASPTLCHATQAVRCMRSGKAVLCEKMMGAELSDTLWMQRVARDEGVVLLEAMRPAHDPAYGVIKKSLGRLGKIRRATLEFCQYSSRYDRFRQGEVLNAFDPKMKNSALSDIGIYPLTVALMLFGKPTRVHLSSVFLENGFEGSGILTLSYPDKGVTVAYSKITEGVNPSVIEGEEGSLTINKLTSPTELILRLRGKAPEIIPVPTAENNMVYEIRAFMDAVNLRRDPTPFTELTEAAARIVDEVYRQEGIAEHFPKD